MSTVELHQLLNTLVEVWPEEHIHPVVEQVREYLSAADQPEQFDNTLNTLYEEHYIDALWFSI